MSPDREVRASMPTALLSHALAIVIIPRGLSNGKLSWELLCCRRRKVWILSITLRRICLLPTGFAGDVRPHGINIRRERRQMKQRVILVCVAIILVIALAGCGGGNSDEDLIGSWSICPERSIAFNEDGTGRKGPAPFTWSRENGSLNIAPLRVPGGEWGLSSQWVGTHKYSISGSTLTIWFEGLALAQVYTRD